MAKKPKRSVGARIIAGLKDAVERLEAGEPLTYRTVAMQLEPSAFTPKKVVATRDLLAVSQGMFAQFLGVSASTVRAWEQGAKDPSDIACRFMDEIRKDPDYWRKRLRESLKIKTAVRST
jgi:putative transcriptional regulator